MELTKICNKCETEKLLDLFYKDSRGLHGRKAVCKECKKKYDQRRHEINRDEDNARRKQYRLDNLEEERRKGREWSKREWSENTEHARLVHKRYRDNNKDIRNERFKLGREVNPKKYKKYNETYYLNNKHVRYANNALKRAVILRATLAGTDTQQLKEIYKTAISLNEKSSIRYHVDHIIPLVSDLVCGLHTPQNLRIVTAEENLKKSNKLDAELLRNLGYEM